MEVFLSEGHDPIEVPPEEEDISNNISGRKCNILYPEGPEFFQSSRVSDSCTASQKEEDVFGLVAPLKDLTKLIREQSIKYLNSHS